MSSAERYVQADTQAGFTLLEALVALAVLAVGAIGLLRAAEGHVDRVRELEQRMLATWLAEAVLADLCLGRIAPEHIASPQDMGGQAFAVRVETHPTEDPELMRVDIDVWDVRDAQAAAALSDLTGFVDLGGKGP